MPHPSQQSHSPQVHGPRRGFPLALAALTLCAGAATTACGQDVTRSAEQSSPAAPTSASAADAPAPAGVSPVAVEPAVAPAPAPPAPTVPPAPPVPFDRCPAAYRACVDIDGKHAWLQRDGRVEFGPVPINTGGPGYESPRGSFTVLRKVIDDYSRVFDNSPMPYSVYFTNVGHAFHMADIAGTSHGCVRLTDKAAPVFFDSLTPGDAVHLF